MVNDCTHLLLADVLWRMKTSLWSGHFIAYERCSTLFKFRPKVEGLSNMLRCTYHITNPVQLQYFFSSRWVSPVLYNFKRTTDKSRDSTQSYVIMYADKILKNVFQAASTVNRAHKFVESIEHKRKKVSWRPQKVWDRGVLIN